MTTGRVGDKQKSGDQVKRLALCLGLPLALALLCLLGAVHLLNVRAVINRQSHVLSRTSDQLSRLFSSDFAHQAASQNAVEVLLALATKIKAESSLAVSPQGAHSLSEASNSVDTLLTTTAQTGLAHSSQNLRRDALAAIASIQKARVALKVQGTFVSSGLTVLIWFAIVLVPFAFFASKFFVFAALNEASEKLEFELGVTQQALDAQTAAIANAATELQKVQGHLRDATIDLGDIRRIHDASGHRFNALFQGLAFPTFTVNEVGRIVEWNHAAAEFFGLMTYEVIDHLLTEIFHTSEGERAVGERLRTLAGGGRPDLTDVSLLLAGGRRVHVEWMSYPVRSIDGTVIGSLHALQDLTTLDEVKAELTASQRVLQIMEASSGSVLATFCATGWYGGEQAARILSTLGYSSTESRQFRENILVHLLHPQDASEVARSRRAWRGDDSDEPQTLRLRLRRADGRYQSVLSVETLVSRTARGEPNLVAGYLAFGQISSQVTPTQELAA